MSTLTGKSLFAVSTIYLLHRSISIKQAFKPMINTIIQTIPNTLPKTNIVPIIKREMSTKSCTVKYMTVIEFGDILNSNAR